MKEALLVILFYLPVLATHYGGIPGGLCVSTLFVGMHYHFDRIQKYF